MIKKDKIIKKIKAYLLFIFKVFFVLTLSFVIIIGLDSPIIDIPISQLITDITFKNLFSIALIIAGTWIIYSEFSHKEWLFLVFMFCCISLYNIGKILYKYFL